MLDVKLSLPNFSAKVAVMIVEFAFILFIVLKSKTKSFQKYEVLYLLQYFLVMYPIIVNFSKYVLTFCWSYTLKGYGNQIMKHYPGECHVVEGFSKLIYLLDKLVFLLQEISSILISMKNFYKPLCMYIYSKYMVRTKTCTLIIECFVLS